MITVGLVNELHFLSTLGTSTISAIVVLKDLGLSVTIEINKQRLEVIHEGEKIWSEGLSPDTSNFGLESCQQIAAILTKKVSGLPYQNLIYMEK